MPARHRWHSRDIRPAQLRDLVPLPRIQVHKPIHIADAEFLDPIAGRGLPRRFQDRDPAAGLVVVRDHGGFQRGVQGGGGGFGSCKRGGGKRVDLDGVVVRGGGDLAGSVEGRVGD